MAGADDGGANGANSAGAGGCGGRRFCVFCVACADAFVGINRMSVAAARAAAKPLCRNTLTPHPDIAIFVDLNSGNFKPIPAAYGAWSRSPMSR
jgi:hypothetical protein